MNNDNQLMTQQPQQMTPSGMLAWGPQRLEGALQFAETLLRGGLLPKAYNNPGAVLTAMILGEELGMTPMMAVRGIHVISGKPTLSAEMMVALVKRRPDVCKYFRMVESTDQQAVYETLREGEPEPTRYAFTIEMAKRANLLKNPTWRSHPEAMLRARCASALARMVFPDLVGGLYETDEGREIAGMYDAPPQYQPRQPSRPPQPHPQQHPAVGRVTEAFEDAEVIEESPNPAEAIKAELAKRGWKVADLNAWLREVDSPPIETIAQDSGELAGFADDYLHKGGADAMAASIQRRADELTGNR